MAGPCQPRGKRARAKVCRDDRISKLKELLRDRGSSRRREAVAGATLLRARLQDRRWNCLSKCVPNGVWKRGKRIEVVAAAVRRWPRATLLRARLQNRQWNCLSKCVPKWSLGTREKDRGSSRRREAVAEGHALTSAATGSAVAEGHALTSAATGSAVAGGHALTSAATESAMELPQQVRSQMEFGNEGRPRSYERGYRIGGGRGPRSYERGYRIGNGIASASAFPNGVWERGKRIEVVAAAVRRWPGATLLRARLQNRRWPGATLLRAQLQDRRWPGATLLRARLQNRRWNCLSKCVPKWSLGTREKD